MKKFWLSWVYIISLGLITACTQPAEESDPPPETPSESVSQGSPTPAPPGLSELDENPPANAPTTSPDQQPLATNPSQPLPAQLPPVANPSSQPPPNLDPEDSVVAPAPTIAANSQNPRQFCGNDHLFESMNTPDYQIFICLNQSSQTDRNYRYVGIEKKTGSKIVLPAQTTGEYYALSYKAVNGDVTYKIETNPQALRDARLVVTQGNKQLLSQRIEQRELILD
ncbi:hypothetical protein [Acaryochloris marina]|uniref:Lipoprotein n=2 Tax=Acaryochloris marina TaxID=155978 RepID=B0C197_ACAM1|nr:hypothetical protein [Acaryochloris marina]ABW28495.1 hypothetical protein AM1_3505 [Acaryochloris marina MBIC11017]